MDARPGPPPLFYLDSCPSLCETQERGQSLHPATPPRIIGEKGKSGSSGSHSLDHFNISKNFWKKLKSTDGPLFHCLYSHWCADWKQRFHSIRLPLTIPLWGFGSHLPPHTRMKLHPKWSQWWEQESRSFKWSNMFQSGIITHLPPLWHSNTSIMPLTPIYVHYKPNTQVTFRLLYTTYYSEFL